MLREAVELLPDGVNQVPIGAAILLCALGFVLWLFGGRVSRSVLVLAAVAAGTVLGMRLPGWRGWQVDGMGLAVGGAMLCGGMVFFMHSTCIGLLLSGALTLWTGLGLWIFMGGGANWDGAPRRGTETWCNTCAAYGRRCPRRCPTCFQLRAS